MNKIMSLNIKLNKVGEKMKLKYLLLFIAVVISLFTLSCKKKEAIRPENAISVLVAAPIKQSLEEYIDLSAEITSPKEVIISSDVPGKISQITKYEGSFVGKGDTIAYIDRFVIGANYALAPARTPIAGYVTTTYIATGAAVNAGTPIATVADISKLEIQIQVPERSVAQIHVGQKVLIRVPSSPNKQFEATITKRDYAVDPKTRTLLVKAEIDNKDRLLLPGMFSDVSILLNSAGNVFVIPNSAVFTGDDGKSYVYIVKEDNTVPVDTVAAVKDTKKDSTSSEPQKKYRSAVREIKILFPSRDKIALSGGLSEGEEVIMFGREFLKNNSLINPIRGDSSTSEYTTQKTNIASTNAAGTNTSATVKK